MNRTHRGLAIIALVFVLAAVAWIGTSTALRASGPSSTVSLKTIPANALSDHDVTLERTTATPAITEAEAWQTVLQRGEVGTQAAPQESVLRRRHDRVDRILWRTRRIDTVSGSTGRTAAPDPQRPAASTFRSVSPVGGRGWLPSGEGRAKTLLIRTRAMQTVGWTAGDTR